MPYIIDYIDADRRRQTVHRQTGAEAREFIRDLMVTASELPIVYDGTRLLSDAEVREFIKLPPPP